MSAAAPPARGPALAEDRATLPPEPRSASAARRLVRRLLLQSGREEWLDATELAVSEVVSNAILHAHTDVEVTVRVLAEAVRVDVLDHSPLLPTQRSYDEMATTGRGLGLVAVVSTAFGIEPREGNGKTVWFCVGDAPAAEADDVLASWADLDEPHGGGAPGTTDARTAGPGGSEDQPVTALLVRLPVRLWLAAQQHHDAVMREYVLAAADRPVEAQDGSDGARGTGAPAGTLPGPAAVQAADDAQGVLAGAVDRALEAARAAGEPAHPLPEGHPSPLPEVPAALDVRVTVGADDVPAFAALQDVLDGAERLAVAGRLLARPALPEVVAVRDWVCEQVIAQAGGVGPSPWPGLDAALEEPDHGGARPVPPPRWDTSPVRAADRPVVAADDSNRIIAVSEPLARLVGWPAEELVGRRVVALIPHRLRELHVAGFTRHLTTGEAYVLGVPLQLPVLRADGTEVVCEFLVERVPDTGTRAVYLAWMSEASTA